MSISRDWSTFQQQFLRYTDPSISLDYSRMGVSEEFISEQAPLVERAIADMQALEAGGIANPDEGRMVGHYWLRKAELAPAELQEVIRKDLADLQVFASELPTQRTSSSICSSSGLGVAPLAHN